MSLPVSETPLQNEEISVGFTCRKHYHTAYKLNAPWWPVLTPISPSYSSYGACQQLSGRHFSNFIPHYKVTELTCGKIGLNHANSGNIYNSNLPFSITFHIRKTQHPTLIKKIMYPRKTFKCKKVAFPSKEWLNAHKSGPTFLFPNWLWNLWITIREI